MTILAALPLAERVEAICLKNPSGTSEFARSFVVPVHKALNEPLIEESNLFDEEHARVIIQMAQSLKDAYQPKTLAALSTYQA